MRLLCINPNTTQAMTDTVTRLLRAQLPAGVEIVAETARFGAPVIASRASAAVGAHAALESMARRASEPWDAVLLLCFGEPGLLALREIAAVPVLGMAEASMTLAARRHGVFSIVTGGAAWEPMLHDLAATVGFTDRLASVRTTVANGGDIFKDPAGARMALLQAIAACVDDGAACVILGGAGLAGLAGDLQSASPLPLIDATDALATVACEIVRANQAAGHGQRLSPLAADLFAAGWI